MKAIINAKRNLLIFAVYAVIVIGFSLFWARHFADYTRYKGDESFFEIEFIAAVTLITGIILKATNSQMRWYSVLVIPLYIGLFCIFTTIFLCAEVINGTTVNNIRAYGVIHTFMAILMFYAYIYKRQNVSSDCA